jgi:hypothetical protein
MPGLITTRVLYPSVNKTGAMKLRIFFLSPLANWSSLRSSLPWAAAEWQFCSAVQCNTILSKDFPQSVVILVSHQAYVQHFFGALL